MAGISTSRTQFSNRNQTTPPTRSGANGEGKGDSRPRAAVSLRRAATMGRASPQAPSAGHQLIRQLTEAALLGLGRMALDAMSRLFDAREPSRSDRNEGNPAQVHDERARLAVAGCHLAIECQHAERQRHARRPRPAGRIGHKRRRHGRGRRSSPGGDQRIAKMQRARPCRVLVLWKGAPYEVAFPKRK